VYLYTQNGTSLYLNYQVYANTVHYSLTMFAESTMYGLACDTSNNAVYLIQYMPGSMTATVKSSVISFGAAAYHLALNSPLTKIAVVGTGQIKLYQACANSTGCDINQSPIAALCNGTLNVAYSRSGAQCSCPSTLPYYDDSPAQTDCQPCVNHGCATCTTGSACATCVSSTPARTGTLCACPQGE
jgi:hypothetical protein